MKQRLIGVAVVAAVAGLAVVGLMVEPEHAIAARSAMAETAVPPKTAPGTAQPAPAPAPAAAERRVYPYSIIPGGVSGKEELASVIKTDKVVAAHYASFDVAKAFKLTVQKPRAVYVSYRKGDQVYWTSRKLMLVKGEMLLSDGRNEMRARCANRISDTPQFPVEVNEPSAEELDSVMAVSMDLDDLGLDDTGAGTGYGPGLGPASGEPSSANNAGQASPDASRTALVAKKPVSGRATTLRPEPSDPSSGATPETPVAVPPPQSNDGVPGNTPGTPPLAGGGTPAPSPAPLPAPPPAPSPAPSPELSPPPSGGPVTPGPGGPPPRPAPPGANPPAGIPPGDIPGTPFLPPVVPEPPVFPPTELPHTPGEPEHALPEPGTLLLFGAAFAGILLLRRKPARSKR
ncbi:PEP-CTERM sorting domain-containing protein [Massilia soli]|uniref:PEP-CTERM sorting domain-containing protein n=1 Tax=Massilia soli TaxID=2792854 RepID=UPI001CBCB6AE|nr:PEP-CTERM sorting domain-containing protein [Massilia soli]